MKIYMLVSAVGVAIGMVGTLYRMRGAEKERPVDAGRNRTAAVCLGVGTIFFFVVGAIGVIVSWNS